MFCFFVAVIRHCQKPMWGGKGFLFGLWVTVHYLGKQVILVNFFFSIALKRHHDQSNVLKATVLEGKFRWEAWQQTSKHGAETVVMNSPLIFKQGAERKKLGLGLVVFLKLKAHPPVTHLNPFQNSSTNQRPNI